jgi:hypothetical protein
MKHTLLRYGIGAVWMGVASARVIDFLNGYVPTHNSLWVDIILGTAGAMLALSNLRILLKRDVQ